MLNELRKTKADRKANNQGFTIIEVMIVLAIAGLILLIVFLAIPALQRNSRNTSRKGDVARVGLAVNEWISNNNGRVLTAGAGNANLTQIINNAGNLGEYTLVAASAIGANSLTLATGTQAAMAPGTNNVNLGSIQIVTGASCGTSGATVASTSNRRTALQYLVETSTNPTPLCLEVE